MTLGVGSLLALALVAALSAQGQPDRSKPPSLGPVPQLKLPAIQKRALSNGVPVWLIEAHEVPLVQVTLLLKSGSSDDPADKYGLASLTAAMLDEGAGSRSALEVADEIDFLGADLGTNSSFDASAVRLGVPVARLSQALSVMADVALRPTFPDAELERVRQERLTDLLQARDDAATVAPMAFARQLFGPAHRYGTGAIGTATTIKGLTTSDLKSFHAAAYQPANATLIVVGDLTADSVMPQLEKQFGSWRA
ncbi:MAG TPA: pitrilysin family protein, partial [Vicinamibacterales bacterium]|nr:pitrilysin family protein [Vicinamibacterales bacterium]